MNKTPTTEYVLQYIGIMVVLLFVLSIGIVRHYSEPGFPWHSSVTIMICYFCSFGILLIIPPDIASAIVERNSTGSLDGYYNDVSFLSVFYNTLFVTILVMGSLVLVFEEYYNTDGYFSFPGRFLSAFKRMMIINIAGVIAGVIVFGILIGQHVVEKDASAIELVAILISNIIYETFLMFLMGYGLIELPRSVWLSASLDSALLRSQMRACADFKDISNAQITMALSVANVIKTRNDRHACFSKDETLNKAMNILTAECPSEFRSSRNGEAKTDKKGNVTIHTLAAMRTNLNEAKDIYRTAQTKIESTKHTAYRLMDIMEARDRRKSHGTNTIHWSMTNTESTVWEYNWHIHYSPILLRLLAIALGLMSLFSFLGVISTMQGVSNNSSVYYLAVHRGQPSFAGVTIFILITMGYAAYTALWSLFQMHFAGMMTLVPHRTSAVCLSFNARMCARLAAPMAFFYLGWIAESGVKSGPWLYRPEPSTIAYNNVTTTAYNSTQVTYSLVAYDQNNDVLMRSAFSHFYQMDKIGVFRSFFGLAFPILLIIVMALVLTNVLNYILYKVGLESLQMGTVMVNKEQLEEGKRKLERYRKTTERATQRSAHKNQLLGFLSSGETWGFCGLRRFLFVFFGGSNGPKESQDGTDVSYAERLKQQRAAAQGEDETPEGVHLSALLRRQPKEIMGNIERKKYGIMGLSNSWKLYRAVVMPPGVLVFSPVDPTVSSHAPPPPVDLSLVVNFTLPRSQDQVNTRLVLEMSDEIIKIRFRSVQDLEEWSAAFKLWKEYAIDYGNYQQGNENLELGAKLDELKISMDDDEDVEEGKNTPENADKIVGQKSGRSPFHGILGIKKKTNSDDSEDMLTSVGYVPPLVQPSAGPGPMGTAGSVPIGVPVGGSKALFSEEKPTGITEGWLEKKKSSKMFSMGAEWQKRYVRIDVKTRSLMYGKSPSMSHDDSAATSIDLIVVSDIVNEDADGRSDSTRITLVGVGGGVSPNRNDKSDRDRGDKDRGEDESEEGDSRNLPVARGQKVKVVQFRAVSGEEGEKWVKSLNDWRDYFLMQYSESQGI